MVCPDEEYRKDLERFIKKMLKRNIADLNFYLSTWEKMKRQGINRQTLQKIELN